MAVGDRVWTWWNTKPGRGLELPEPTPPPSPMLPFMELLGRRWAMRVLWELRSDALTFRALRAACDDISPTVLQTRLDELREAGLVTHEAGKGYHLTPLGRDFKFVFVPMSSFAQRWVEETVDA